MRIEVQMLTSHNDDCVTNRNQDVHAGQPHAEKIGAAADDCPLDLAIDGASGGPQERDRVLQQTKTDHVMWSMT